MRTTFRLFSLAAALLVAASALATTGALEDERVQEILTLARAGIPASVILAEVEDIGSFPELDADDLVALHEAGVSEEAMVRMIQLGAKAPVEPAPSVAAAPAPAPVQTGGAAAAPVTDVPEPTVADPAGRIEVVLKRDFRITFYEVLIDGETNASSGRLWEGESEPGMMLRRPGRVRKDNTFTALDLDVEPGSYEVAVGFAVSVVEDDPDLSDEWGKFTVEQYINRGVRASASPEDPVAGEWGTPAAIDCTVAAGETCTVTATLERRAPTRFGGIPVYNVSYTVD